MDGRPVRRAIVAALLLSTVLSAAAAQSLGVPHCDGVVLEPTRAVVTISNPTSLSLTAWAVELRGAYRDGTPFRVRQTIDVMPSLAQVGEARVTDLTVPGGGRKTVIFGLGPDGLTDPTCELIATVYLDRSAQGNEPTIEQIFAERRKVEEDARRLLALVPKTSDADVARGRLMKLRNESRRIAEEGQTGSGERRGLAHEVSSALDAAGSDAVRSLDAISTYLTSIHANAALHSVRRK